MQLVSNPTTFPMLAVMIHDVSSETSHLSGSSTSTVSDRLGECAAAGVLVFQTYVDATAQLVTRGVLSMEATGSVIRSAISDLSAIRFESELQKRNATTQVLAAISSVVDATTSADAMLVLEAFQDRRRLRRPPPVSRDQWRGVQEVV